MGSNPTLSASPLTGRIARLAIATAVAAGIYVGWRTFFFLTDDAYIAFRYVHNHLAGHGWVWNPAPFRPVEGYTCFLWLCLLELVWRLTGVAPPEAANWVSLALGFASVAVGWRMLERMTLPAGVARARLLLLALVMLAVTTNRTFLTWLSSGLETSLFNFVFLWWLERCFAPAAARGPRWVAGLASSATLAALTRPDGVLLAGATGVILALEARSPRGAVRDLRGLAAATPLLLVPLHLAWRRATYGDWLPNTYHAKVVAPWPESGVRYAASFVLEYGVWVWALLLLSFCLAALRRGRLGVPGPSRTPQALALCVVILHVGYYTFVVGGDHFEYRVYSHLVIPLCVSSVWLAARTVPRVSFVTAALALLVAASLPIPWVHWQLTRDVMSRGATSRMARPIAQRFPAPLRQVVARWDEWQAWLIHHHVGNRHQEHKVFHDYLARILPPRAEGARIRWEERAVLAASSIGMRGWRLPEVAVIDTHGLTDRVVARTPPAADAERLMAHERRPPEGYVECFRPNVEIRERRAVVTPREPPLGDAAIRACESRRWGEAPP